jgi:UDP-glucose 4-epimerase
MADAVRVLVTGGAGFIGSHLCRLLATRGHDVVVFDNMSTGSIASLLDADIEVVVGDARDASALSKAGVGVTAIVHLAAIVSVAESVADPLAVHDVNVTGTLNVFELARRHTAPVTFASSAAVYGSPLIVPIREESPIQPLSPYGASKASAEVYAHAYTATYGLPVAVLRLFNVYGPGQSPTGGAAVPSLIAACRSGRPMPIQGDGSQRRDLIYVADVARVIAESVERRFSGLVNVGSGVGTSINELAARLAEVAGIPYMVEASPSRAGDIRDSVADICRLRALFDFTPTPLSAGLTATFDGACRLEPVRRG